MSIVGEHREWGVDFYALQHFSQDPPDLPGGQLLIDGEPYPPEVGGGGSAHIIQDEGVSLTDRATLNFVGSGVTVTDAGGKTVVTIPGDAVTSVNGETGDVVLDTDGVSEGATNKYNATHTGDVTGATSLTIANDAVTNAKAANMAESTIKGRAASAGTGDPTDLTPAQVRTIINVADGANAYTHPNHTGDVTSTGDGATVIASNAVVTAKILDANVTNAKLANMATKTLKGRNSSGTGVPEDVTALQLRSFIKRTSTETSNATPSIDSDAVDAHYITALAANITSITVTGTPFNGQLLWIGITGTATRTIAMGSSFEASTVALPTTTDGTNLLDILCRWNSATSKWRVVAVA